MLHIVWTPGGHAPPADPAYPAIADTLALPGGALLQSLPRGAPLPKTPGAAMHATITGWLAQRDPSRPVVVMVHGWQYNPTDPSPTDGANPYTVIYGIPEPGKPDTVSLSFLPIVGECDDQGANQHDTALAYGWMSDPALAAYVQAGFDRNYVYACLDIAPLAARGLALILAGLAEAGATVRILAHSLGTRTTSQAIGLAKAANMKLSVDRIILLDGAEFCRDALRNFADTTCDIVNIASMSDKVLEWGGETLCCPPRSQAAGDMFVLGRTGLGTGDRYLDIQLDDPTTQAWFASGKAPTGKSYNLNATPENNAHAVGWMGHWTCYTNNGNRTLITDLLYADTMTAPTLRAAGAPGTIDNIFWNTIGTEPPPTPTPPDLTTRQSLARQIAANPAADRTG